MAKKCLIEIPSPESERPKESAMLETLNQVLIDWWKEGKTETERAARYEAYKRFFEIFDEKTGN